MTDTPTNAPAPDTSTGSNTVIVTERGDGMFTQQLFDGRHRLLADEPVSAGGMDLGPGPYELLLMALGACTSMTVRMYARRKQWPLERVTVRLRHSRNYVQDCADCDSKAVELDHIDRELEFAGTLSAEQSAKLLEIADKCPVHETLSKPIGISTTLAKSSKA
jgi:putative redox protein